MGREGHGAPRVSQATPPKGCTSTSAGGGGKKGATGGPSSWVGRVGERGSAARPHWKHSPAATLLPAAGIL